MSDNTSRAPKNAGAQKKSAAAAHLDDLISTSPQPSLRLSSPAAVLALQRTIGNRAVSKLIQRNRPEDFDSLEDAKQANSYSMSLLDEQANDTLESHIGKGFSPQEIASIYDTNKNDNDSDDIHSDSDGSTLYLQDTSTTPHIDHRFPKNKGGTNSYTNAAVIPADENIRKSDKTDLDEEPDTPLPPYTGLNDHGNTVGQFMNFSGPQKAAIYAANRAYYSTRVVPGDQGKIISDSDEETPLEDYDSSSVPHVDHITPKSSEGSSFYFNAQVLSAEENIGKGGNRKRKRERYDWLELQMTLREYYRYREIGEIPERLNEPSDDEDHPRKKRKIVRAKKKETRITDDLSWGMKK